MSELLKIVFRGGPWYRLRQRTQPVFREIGRETKICNFCDQLIFVFVYENILRLDISVTDAYCVTR